MVPVASRAVPGYRYLLRTADGHSLGEYVTDRRWRWAEGDEFTGPGTRQFAS
jgi:hypothetical protein